MRKRTAAYIPLTLGAALICTTSSPAQEIQRGGPSVIHAAQLQTTPDPVLTEIASRLRKLFESSKISAVTHFEEYRRAQKQHNWLVAQVDTQQFTIHSKNATGEFEKVPHQELGPNNSGFLLRLTTRREAPYLPSGLLPLELKETYWTTQIQRFDAGVVQETTTKVIQQKTIKLTPLLNSKIPAEHWTYEALDMLSRAGMVPEFQRTIDGKATTWTRQQFAVTIQQLLRDWDIRTWENLTLKSRIWDSRAKIRVWVSQQKPPVFHHTREALDIIEALQTEFSDELRAMDTGRSISEAAPHGTPGNNTHLYLNMTISYGDRTNRQHLNQIKAVLAKFAAEYSQPHERK